MDEFEAFASCHQYGVCLLGFKAPAHSSQMGYDPVWGRTPFLAFLFEVLDLLAHLFDQDLEFDRCLGGF